MSPPRRDYNYEWMLRDWYGGDRGRSEIAAKQPPPKSLSDALDNAVRGIIPKSLLTLSKLQEQWCVIVGPANAKHTKPSHVKDGVLYVEISHPAFRMAIDTPKMRELFLSKIHAEFGKEICSELKFIPVGRRAPG